ncbi:MAG: patatin-like phospholipase family protein [Solirubrobacterales bacterium]|nr:patatin-like phospholipase family protein [Solirubrobacterales bacterium]HMT06164.1 patatin-like phospholipase family protein [Solirubrobacterales bacterium]
MGKVVNIEESQKRRSNAKKRERSRTALVLGGGGFTGGVYEIGALRALDLLAVNSTVNDFDMYVGTSAGSFIGSMLAAGVTPEEMMRVLTDEEGSPIERIGQDTVLRPNLGEYVNRIATLPVHVAGMVKSMVPRFRDVSVIDIAYGLAEHLPTGMYSNAGIAAYVREALATKGIVDSFDAIPRELYLTGTDLDSGERVVFGDKDGDWAGVPVSKAVECSTALPLVYEPVEVNGRTLVDGGIYSTTNVDVAVERGAEFIVVVNPLVPYANDRNVGLPMVSGNRVRRIVDMGLPAIANQAFRLLLHQRLAIAVESWKERYPGVDILLLEPEPDDELMFGTSIMDYSRRLDIATHGFETVTAHLAEDYAHYTEVAEKHGIEISATRLRRVVRKVKEQESSDASVWRRIFEQTTGALLRQTGTT